MMQIFPNQYHRLRAQRFAESTREFLARGKSVERCDICQLASYACLCGWQPELTTKTEFVLLMHRNEVFKPTNTGRLIADVFPQNTHVYCWSRTEPDIELLTLLKDSQRNCLIVFPSDAAEVAVAPRAVVHAVPANEKINTFILLDGTWKQSGRMFHLSRWLDEIPSVVLPETLTGSYAVRKSHQEGYLSTAEAAALCLSLAGEKQAADVLLDYFQLFNQHYLATRGCYRPVISELHHKLALLKRT